MRVALECLTGQPKRLYQFVAGADDVARSFIGMRQISPDPSRQVVAVRVSAIHEGRSNLRVEHSSLAAHALDIAAQVAARLHE